MKSVSLIAAATIAAFLPFTTIHAAEEAIENNTVAAPQTTAESTAEPIPENSKSILKIRDVWSRAIAEGMPTGVVYATFVNTSNEDEYLIGAATPVSETVELHAIKPNQDGIMRMRKIDKIAIAAQSVQQLRPGSYHLMLIGMKQGLQAGDAFPITLEFSKSGTKEIIVTVPE